MWLEHVLRDHITCFISQTSHLLKPQWPHLYNGDKREVSREGALDLGSGVWVPTLALLAWLCVPRQDSASWPHCPGLHVEMIILPP